MTEPEENSPEEEQIPEKTPAEITREYLEEYDIQQVLQASVNELMESRPIDVFGVLHKIIKRKALPPIIDHVVGREVLDSRGNPTVEVDVYAKYLNEVKFVARSSAPSGASTGSNEARELRDTNSPRYFGKSVETAVKNVSEKLSPALQNQYFNDLHTLDEIICQTDGTQLKENIGGNACTATSFALAEAAAAILEEPLFVYLAKQFHSELPQKYRLPTPFFNVLNGGKHAGGNLKIQEFMISPRSDVSFPEQLRMITEVYHKLGVVLVKNYGVSAKNLGDEGGYAPPMESPSEAIETIEKAIILAGYKPGTDVFIGLDAAASEFYNNQTHQYEVEVGHLKTGEEMIEYWKALVEAHPSIISIEDGLDEKDYETWPKLNAALGDRIQLVGDDLYTTNPETIVKGLEGNWANALLLKVNQIGTISEAMKAAKLVLDAGQKVMVSHRSGETCNSVIADLAVAIGAQSIKTGSVARGERIQKYTRLLQIYEYLREKDMLEII